MSSAPGRYSDSARLDTRLRISALWVAVLFVFAYVDLFSLYRPDFRADLEKGRVFVFDVNGTFLFFTTLYIVIPSLMVFLTLVMRPTVNRVVNMIVAAVYGVTILGGAVGEWTYYVFGSLVETALLVVVIHQAWTWPRTTSTAPD